MPRAGQDSRALPSPGHQRRGQARPLVQVVNHGKVLRERRKEQNGKRQAVIFHLQLCILQHRPLLIELNLGFDDVTVRGLALALLVLRHCQEALRLFQALLRGRVFPLRHDQGVIIFSDGDLQPPARDFGLGSGQRLQGRAPSVPQHGQSAQGKFLVYNSPLAVNMDAIIGDESTRGNLPVALGEQRGGLQTHRREARCTHLHVVFLGELGIRNCSRVLRVIFLSAVEGVLERDCYVS